MLINLPYNFSIYPESVAKDSWMSAIAVIYTRDGFVLAADGRRSLDDDATEAAQFLLSDMVQKIFPVEDRDRTLAYAITGLAGSDDGKFDTYVEAAKQTERLSNLEFRNLDGYAEEFCRGLNKAFNLTKKQGHVPRFPQIKRLPQLGGWGIATAVFAGYFQGAPSWSYADFFHHDNLPSAFRVNVAPISPGNRLFSGSGRIQQLTYPNDRDTKTDPRFARYIKPTGPDTSLEGAVDIGRGFIEAHSDPVALQEDYDVCKRVGGHIHIAKVTPSGFEWLVKPKTPAK